MNNVKELLETIRGNVRVGLYNFDIIVEGKKTLKDLRKSLDGMGYTIAKVIYRNGKYVVTIIADKVNRGILAYAGYTTFTKNAKDKLVGKLTQTNKKGFSLMAFESLR